LGGVKIEIHIQMFDKFCNRVTIGIWFLCTILNIFLWNTSILYQILLALTCWMTFTKSFNIVRRFCLLIITAVVKYRRIWGHMVSIAFRYLK
jgi:hypothetical protein